MLVTSDFRQEVEIWPFSACAMHQAVIIGTVCSLWNWLWGGYHVPQNVFLLQLFYSSFISYMRTLYNKTVFFYLYFSLTAVVRATSQQNYKSVVI